MTIHVRDNCHFEFTSIVQAGMPTVKGVVFTKAGCTTAATVAYTWSAHFQRTDRDLVTLVSGAGRFQATAGTIGSPSPAARSPCGAIPTRSAQLDRPDGVVGRSLPIAEADRESTDASASVSEVPECSFGSGDVHVPLRFQPRAADVATCANVAAATRAARAASGSTLASLAFRTTASIR
jgi:hypothetical protein